jgi:hypothetical protein
MAGAGVLALLYSLYGLFWPLITIIQVVCLIHVFRTGSEYWWAFIIIFFPAFGALAYLFMEILPYYRGQSVEKITSGVADKVIKTIQPTRELKRLKEELQIADTVKNRHNLARESARCGLFDESIHLYKSCLTGIYQDDTEILYDLAKTYFCIDNFQETKATLLRIIAVNPKYRPAEVKLLLARVLEELNEKEEADKVYEEITASFSGLEAKCRYAMFLRKTGNPEKASSILQNVVLSGSRLPKHSQRAQREWISFAKKNTV